jgi:predicted MFS family arabinose efflux permease
LAPQAALHAAAAIACACMLALLWWSFFMVSEARNVQSAQVFKLSWRALKQAMQSRGLWLLVALAWCWNFMPCFGVPLYFHESNTLGFSQASIGQLGAINAAGMLVGAVVYGKLFKDRTLQKQVMLAAMLLTISIGFYGALSSQLSGLILEFARGVSSMISLLTLYSLAADICPEGIEVSMLALFLGVRNLATEASTFIGGFLFTHVFHNTYWPLVLITAAGAGLSAIFVGLIYQRSQVNDSPTLMVPEPSGLK